MPTLNKPLRVKMITTRFYPDHGGGARQALHLCLALRELGVESSILTGHDQPHIIKGEISGLPVTRVPLPKSMGLPVIPGYFTRLRHLLGDRAHYDVIHAHAIHHHAYAGFIAGKLLNKPSLVKVTSMGHDDPGSLSHRTGWRIQRSLLNLADGMIALTEEINTAVLDAGWPPEKVFVIPNGVNVDTFTRPNEQEKANARERYGVPQDALVMAYLGIISHSKGIDILAEIWPKILAAHPSAHLLLIGPATPGEHHRIDPAFIAQVKSNLGANVHWIGKVDNPQDYLQAADMFVFPSRREGLPNAVLEAMATGLPVVATNLGGIVEVIPPIGLPHLVPVGEAVPFLEQVLALAGYADKRHQLGGANWQAIQDHYSIPAVARQYLALYQKMIASK